ncbi:MAG: kynureninase [Marinilabiliaceae bacterium]|jgi:kynureninase|nr:kynureninase [Marinilabiliaceae bacterium]
MSILSGYKDTAAKLDSEDKLGKFREEFFDSGEKLIYLDGNSLGKMPIRSGERVRYLLDKEWGSDLIRGWNASWWDMPQRAASKISSVIGASENEVIVSDSTSLNLYKLVKAALRLKSERRKIVCESISFPTDLYIIQGVIDQLADNYHLVLAESEDGISVSLDELESLVDDNTALVVLSLVSYRSAAMYDMQKVNDLVHQKGALVIWDLSHAAGAVPLSLKATGADMAVGCTYKYLNCGPGSPAYLYVREDLIESSKSPIWGWFGELRPFDFSKSYRPSNSIKKFMTGTSGIMSMCTIEPSLDIIGEAGMDRIREKNIGLTSFFVKMTEALLYPHGFSLGSPDNPELRGSHVSVRHREAFRISKALIDPECGSYVIIPDFRPPDILRLGFSALYNSYMEVYRTVEELLFIIENEAYTGYSSEREDVT